MELGQMFYGNPTGEFKCPDFVDAFVSYVLREIERVYWNRNQTTWGRDCDPGIPCIVFNPYYWGDCDCGYDERWGEADARWCDENKHAPGCYQTELRARLAEYDEANGVRELGRSVFGGEGVTLMGAFDWQHENPMPGVFGSIGTPRRDDGMKAWSRAREARRKFEDTLLDGLCEKYGLDRRFGGAVHCTCEYEQQRAEWCATDDHDPACSVARPNLASAGAEVRWYKYPGRGMTVNVDWDEARWRRWLDETLALVRNADTKPW